MRRGTTPLYTLTLSVPIELISKLRINWAQNGEILLTKKETDCNINGNTVSVKLTQEETLSFCEAFTTEIEVHVLTTGGESLRSKIMYDAVLRGLSEEVLT